MPVIRERSPCGWTGRALHLFCSPHFSAVFVLAGWLLLVFIA
jgi:hypothetical protein